MKIKIKDKSKIVAKDVEFTDDTYSVPSVLCFCTNPVYFTTNVFKSHRFFRFWKKNSILSEPSDLKLFSICFHGNSTVFHGVFHLTSGRFKPLYGFR